MKSSSKQICIHVKEAETSIRLCVAEGKKSLFKSQAPRRVEPLEDAFSTVVEFLHMARKVVDFKGLLLGYVFRARFLVRLVDVCS